MTESTNHDDIAERLARARQDDSAPEDPKWDDLEPQDKQLLIENATTDLARMAGIGLFVLDVTPPQMPALPEDAARKVRGVVIDTLAAYIREHGEVSDDPDDVMSAASAVWTALGADGPLPPHRVFQDGEIVPAGTCVLDEDGDVEYLDDTADCDDYCIDDCDCSHPVRNGNRGPLVEVPIPDYDAAVAADAAARARRVQS